MDRDQQTHRLPESGAALDLLARRSGMRGAAGDGGRALSTELEKRMNQVREIYRRVIRAARYIPRATDKAGIVKRSFVLEAPYAIERSSDYHDLLRTLAAQFPELHRTAEQAG